MYRYRWNVHAFRDFSAFFEFSINSDAASSQEIFFFCSVRMWIIQPKVNIWCFQLLVVAARPAGRIRRGLDRCVPLVVFIILGEKACLKLLYLSWCSRILICECMSPFNPTLHSLKVFSIPPQLKWVCLLTHARPSASFFSVCSLLLSNAANVRTRVWALRDERLMQV